MFFRKSPPPDAVSALINWSDNPWLPEVLLKEMEHDFASDPDKAEHIWNGAYGSSQGAILARWVNKAEREGRISNDLSFDWSGAPLEISCDIGFRDTASFWYWQRVPGGFNVLKYQGESGLDADDWIPIIQDNVSALGAKLGKIWLPHDAKAKTFQSKHTTMEKFITGFGAAKVGVVAQSKKLDQISAAREVIGRCAFHRDNCESGLDGLRAWEYSYNDDTGVFSREPLHNWASHPSDAFAYGAQVMQDHKADEKKPEPKFAFQGKPGGVTQSLSLDEMWALTPKGNKRI
jgi:phage terminase large subunit